MRISSALAFLVLAAGLFVPAPLAGQEPEIREWDVPWEQTRPRDPFVAPGGEVFFVGQRDDYVAVLDPATGEFRRWDLPEGAGPHNLIVGADGTVWYAGNRDAHIGRLDPASGEIETFPLTDPAVRDPHTMVFGSAGEIWFTGQGANVVGRFDPETGEAEVVEAPTERARPYGIVVDSRSRPWIAMVGTHKLSTVDPETMELREIELPRTDARPRRIGVTSDDRVWYVDYAGGRLGVYDPGTGSFEEWMTPGGEGSRPYGMSVDDRDRIWVAETGSDPNVLVSFDPATEEFVTSTAVPSGGGTVRHMYFDPDTRSVWFGADTNTIGRIRVP